MHSQFGALCKDDGGITSCRTDLQFLPAAGITCIELKKLMLSLPMITIVVRLPDPTKLILEAM